MGELAAQYEGKLGVGLERIVWEAMDEKSKNNIIILEDIDLFCPKRGEAQDTGFLQSLHRIIHDLENIPHIILVSLSKKKK